ncbi:MAG: DUF421 domain-containing protein [Abitibacteriaceae bacterium]|nr:DUF421 domain-containing protein [Abditibacteriaceae bacterium]
MLTSLKPLAVVALHTVAIYLFLVAGLRLLGRRQMGQLTAVDLMIIIVLGSAVETAMVAGNTSLEAGLVSAATLLFVNRGLALVLYRSKRLRHLVVGGPVLLVHFGHFVEEHLRRVGLTEADVLEAIRERGEPGIEKVKFAVLEVDGSINVVPFEGVPCEANAPSGTKPDPPQDQQARSLASPPRVAPS